MSSGKRHSTLIRTLAIWRVIDGAKTRPDLDALAQEHQVTKRTIYRDLLALEAAGCRVPKGFNP